VFRGDWAKNAELLALQHENAVLRRNAGRVRYDPADQVWFAVLTRLILRRRWAEVFRVTPATQLAWHRLSPPGNTTPASVAGPAARRRSGASPGWPSAWRKRTRCGVTAVFTAS
jgi:hypothetical protein